MLTIMAKQLNINVPRVNLNKSYNVSIDSNVLSSSYMENSHIEINDNNSTLQRLISTGIYLILFYIYNRIRFF